MRLLGTYIPEAEHYPNSFGVASPLGTFSFFSDPMAFYAAARDACETLNLSWSASISSYMMTLRNTHVNM